NQLPLLRSSPGGFEGSWPYGTYPCFLFAGAKVGIFFESAMLFAKKVQNSLSPAILSCHLSINRDKKRTFAAKTSYCNLS
ncbi:MAG: hypothetical protein MR387_05045, partial [Phocaeicola plebeius]|nr:hypothetical protein [Phocaeicola plebeius]